VDDGSWFSLLPLQRGFDTRFMLSVKDDHTKYIYHWDILQCRIGNDRLEILWRSGLWRSGLWRNLGGELEEQVRRRATILDAVKPGFIPARE
jgi:hypothetical protein